MNIVRYPYGDQNPLLVVDCRDDRGEIAKAT